MKTQNNSNLTTKAEDLNVPEEDSFYGEAFWIGSEDEEEVETSDELKPLVTATESDKSSQKDDNESVNSQPKPKMSRLTALSKGLLTTEVNGVKKAAGKHKR